MRTATWEREASAGDLARSVPSLPLRTHKHTSVLFKHLTRARHLQGREGAARAAGDARPAWRRGPQRREGPVGKCHVATDQLYKRFIERPTEQPMFHLAQGDPGDPGMSGPQGYQGRQGARGPKGSKGYTGDIGYTVRVRCRCSV